MLGREFDSRHLHLQDVIRGNSRENAYYINVFKPLAGNNRE